MAAGPPPAGEGGCPVCGKVVSNKKLSQHRASQDCRTRAAEPQNAKREETSGGKAGTLRAAAAADSVPMRAEDIANIGGELQQIPLDRHPLPGLILRAPDSSSAAESPPPPSSPAKKKRGAKRPRLE